MKNLSKKNLLAIKGGSVSLAKIGGIGAGIIFLIGVIDGFIRPLKCR